MRRLAFLVLVAAVTALVVTFGATGVSAAVGHKPLPQNPCDLIDVGKLASALGVPIGPATAEGGQPGASDCFVPIPFDRSTCIVQPDPGIRVAAAKPTASQRVSLKQAATVWREQGQGFEVRPLKGKAFGRKGAFLASDTLGSWTFFGGKGPYFIEVNASAPCHSVPMERLATVAAMVAKGVVRRL